MLRSRNMVCRCDLKLMLFIGVDSENKSIVLAQGLFSDEKTTSFLWALKHYCSICGGHPEVSNAPLSKTCVSSIWPALGVATRVIALGVTLTSCGGVFPLRSYHVMIFRVRENKDEGLFLTLTFESTCVDVWCVYVAWRYVGAPAPIPP